MKLILAQETSSQEKYLTSNPSELLWNPHLARRIILFEEFAYQAQGFKEKSRALK